MAKPELGTKRLCANCAAKFYDLNKTPIICPKCHTVMELPAAPTRPRPEPAAQRAAPVKEEAVVPETPDAEFVSLEDADAEAQGKKVAGDRSQISVLPVRSGEVGLLPICQLRHDLRQRRLLR